MLTRDSVLWWIVILGAGATFLASHFDLLVAAIPGLGDVWQARIELVAAVLGFLAGYLRMSPLGLSEAGRQRLTNGSNRISPSTLNKLTSILALVAVASSWSACASLGTKQRAVAAYQGVETALGAFQDAEIALYASRSLPQLTDERHLQIHRVLADAFEAQRLAGFALLAWRSGEPVPASLTAWLDAVDRTLRSLTDLVPESATGIWQTLREWARAAQGVAAVLRLTVPPTVLRYATLM
jgi:hypothetical protein